MTDARRQLDPKLAEAIQAYAAAAVVDVADLREVRRYVHDAVASATVLAKVATGAPLELLGKLRDSAYVVTHDEIAAFGRDREAELLGELAATAVTSMSLLAAAVAVIDHLVGDDQPTPDEGCPSGPEHDPVDVAGSELIAGAEALLRQAAAKRGRPDGHAGEADP